MYLKISSLQNISYLTQFFILYYQNFVIKSHDWMQFSSWFNKSVTVIWEKHECRSEGWNSQILTKILLCQGNKTWSAFFNVLFGVKNHQNMVIFYFPPQTAKSRCAKIKAVIDKLSSWKPSEHWTVCRRDLAHISVLLHVLHSSIFHITLKLNMSWYHWTSYCMLQNFWWKTLNT